MNAQLNAVAESQGQWSATANALKKSHENARRAVFALSTIAALLAAVSSQPNQPRQMLAITSTICMALVTFLTARMLDSKRSQGWVRARAASEGLKREAYRHAAQAAPYDEPDAAANDAKLRAERQKIENDVDDLIGLRLPSGNSSNPRDLITPAEYIARRPVAQIQKFYEPKANQAQKAAARMRAIEFSLAIVTTVITAVMSVVNKKIGDFDVVALIAVLTTLSGAIIAYIEASRYDFTVQTYRSTARRLRDEVDNAPANPEPRTPEWSAFVDRCESILREENTGWIAKFSKSV
jgi:hypothetical protein